MSEQDPGSTILAAKTPASTSTHSSSGNRSPSPTRTDEDTRGVVRVQSPPPIEPDEMPAAAALLSQLAQAASVSSL